jgi:hypothetical protein
VRRLCGKHHLQGVWGAARHGYPLGGGEREGRSPLASAERSISSGEREGRSPLASHPQSGVSAAGAPGSRASVYAILDAQAIAQGANI